MKKALITGVTGQDGSYMADLLLEKGYEVYGLTRHQGGTSLHWRIAHLLNDPRFKLRVGDILDPFTVRGTVGVIEPDEIYHFAAQSFVGRSWADPKTTLETNILGTLNVLEAIREVCPKARMLQASSSEMFGRSNAPQDENTPFHPASPYGVSKTAAHQLAVNYRESYGLFVACSIAFNHESPRRGDTFVTQKIIQAFAQEKATGEEQILKLGNLDARRDWGHALDYVRGMWLMLQQENPNDYVLGTGKTHSIKEFIDEVKSTIESIYPHHGKQMVEIRQEEYLMRPVDDFILQADASKAKTQMGWRPQYGLRDLIKDMFESAVERELKKEKSYGSS